MPMSKRARALPQLVDLTGDDSPPNKKAKTASSTHGSHRNALSEIPLSSGGNWPAPQRYISASTAFAPPSTSEPTQVDLTQDDDGPAKELYGTFEGKIVGIRYYDGYASPGEVVVCHREPRNQYDPNAIRVDNVLGQQIGHLPRKVVEKLAPYIDRDEIALEAQLAGEKAFFDCPVKLQLYGPSDPAKRTQVENSLKADKLLKARELKQTRSDAAAQRALTGLVNGGSTAGFGHDGIITDPEVTLESLLKSSEAVEFRGDGDAIKSMAMGEDELSQMPSAEQPAELLAQLLPYQLQGLAWMNAKESPSVPEKGTSDIIQLWRRDAKGRFWNVASDYVASSPPQLLSGGILADDMGLGKTLQIISLILTGGLGSNLIVCPVSVMSNWEQQIRRHVKPEHMPSILVYHGDKRLTAAELMNYRVVITSYGRLARERDPDVTKALLSPSIEWRRVVLDEGHTIRNAKTKVALAASDLKAKSRWVLTGTPIINSVKDLQSILKFLHITGGIEQPEIFNSKITRKLPLGDRTAEALLQSLMQDVCLRRKKDMKFVDLKLPEKKEFLHRITFRPEEKRKYDALLSEARGVLERYQAKSSQGQKGRFQGVLERLLRLRQTCNHWTLCKERVDDLLKLLDEDVVELSGKNRELLQQALRLFIESQEECAICYDNPKIPVITNCKHVFCRGCIVKAIQTQGKCPMCRNQLFEEMLLEPAPESSGDDNFDVETQSSKTEAMLHILQATLKNPGSKVVIFSQWTSFLTIVQNQLDEEGIVYARIDGSMNPEKRDKAIHALDNDPNTTVLLASLAVCSVGLNLVSADTVILSDSWWAPAIEDQAIDRVHRLGQTRETTVWRLVMEDTVEERVLDIQKEKRELVTKAFHEKDGKKNKAKESRTADVLKLLA